MSIKLISNIVPKNSQSFAILEDKYLQGGLFALASVAELDALHDTVLKVGSLAYLSDYVTGAGAGAQAAYFEWMICTDAVTPTWLQWDIAAGTQNLFSTVTDGSTPINAEATDATLTFTGDTYVALATSDNGTGATVTVTTAAATAETVNTLMARGADGSSRVVVPGSPNALDVANVGHVSTSVGNLAYADSVNTNGGTAHDFTAGGQALNFTDGANVDITHATNTVTVAVPGVEGAAQGLALRNASGELSVATPTANAHAATKEYVDSVAAGLDAKESVSLATTADVGGAYAAGTITGVDLTASGPFDGLVDHEGTAFTLAVDDRVLLRAQTEEEENGIYVVTITGASGALERSSDMDGTPTSEVSAGNYTYVEGGATLTGYSYVVVGDGELTLGTDEINWSLFKSAVNVSGGDGISLDAGVLSRTDGTADLQIPVFGLATTGVWDGGVVTAPSGSNQVLSADTTLSGVNRLGWDFNYREKTLGELGDGDEPYAFSITSATIDSNTISPIPDGRLGRVTNDGFRPDALLMAYGEELESVTLQANIRRRYVTTTDAVDRSGSLTTFTITEADSDFVGAAATFSGWTDEGDGVYSKIDTTPNGIENSNALKTALLTMNDGIGNVTSKIFAGWGAWVYAGIGDASSAVTTESNFHGGSSLISWNGGPNEPKFKQLFHGSEDSSFDIRGLSSTNDYIWVAVAGGVSVTASSFLDNDSGFRGGFSQYQSSVAFTADYANAQSVPTTIWRSDNPNLGSVNITVFLEGSS